MEPPDEDNPLSGNDIPAVPVARVRLGGAGDGAFIRGVSADSSPASVTFRDGYVAAVGEAVLGMGACVHVVIAEGGDANVGPTRAVFLACEHPHLADAVARISESLPRYLDHVVLAHSSVVAEPGDIAAAAREDVAAMFENLYPVEAQGPVAPLVPACVRMATRLVLSLASARGRCVDRAKADAVAGLYRSLSVPPPGPDGDGTAIAHVAEAVASAAAKAAAGMRLPVSRDELVEAVHGAVGEALSGLGCRVVS